jgi:hypothetical protein
MLEEEGALLDEFSPMDISSTIRSAGALDYEAGSVR